MQKQEIEQEKTIDEFLDECEEKTKNFNEKTSYTLLTYWRIIRELLDKKATEGLSSQEIINRLNKGGEPQFRSEPTIHIVLDNLKKFGVLDRPEKRWFANKMTGTYYKRIDDIIPNTHSAPIALQSAVDIRYFDNIQITLPGLPDKPLTMTGSAWLPDFTKKKDINKLLTSGEVEIRASIRPAGAQPIL